MQDRLIIRQAGRCDYEAVYRAMARFTLDRKGDTPDEIWCLQHAPVYTLGLAGREDHILAAGEIPVVRSDRGGQVTYHGPGQLVVYLLLDLARLGLTVKRYVWLLEQVVIDLCAELGMEAARRAGAPGVYIAGKKLAALGIRVKRGYSYHGLALNVAMDLSPYRRIHPCGYPGLEVTQLADHGSRLNLGQIRALLLPHLLERLGYDAPERSEAGVAPLVLPAMEAA